MTICLLAFALMTDICAHAQAESGMLLWTEDVTDFGAVLPEGYCLMDERSGPTDHLPQFRDARPRMAHTLFMAINCDFVPGAEPSRVLTIVFALDPSRVLAPLELVGSRKDYLHELCCKVSDRPAIRFIQYERAFATSKLESRRARYYLAVLRADGGGMFVRGTAQTMIDGYAISVWSTISATEGDAFDHALGDMDEVISGLIATYGTQIDIDGHFSFGWIHIAAIFLTLIVMSIGLWYRRNIRRADRAYREWMESGAGGDGTGRNQGLSSHGSGPGA